MHRLVAPDYPASLDAARRGRADSIRAKADQPSFYRLMIAAMGLLTVACLLVVAIEIGLG